MSNYICIDGRKMLILERDWSNFDGEIVPSTEPCYFCGQRHLHGGIDGHRIPHCASPLPRTCIAADGSILNTEDGYWLMDINKF